MPWGSTDRPCHSAKTGGSTPSAVKVVLRSVYFRRDRSLRSSDLRDYVYGTRFLEEVTGAPYPGTWYFMCDLCWAGYMLEFYRELRRYRCGDAPCVKQNEELVTNDAFPALFNAAGVSVEGMGEGFSWRRAPSIAFLLKWVGFPWPPAPPTPPLPLTFLLRSKPLKVYFRAWKALRYIAVATR